MTGRLSTRLTLPRSSNYEQAEAEICRIEVGEATVALDPPAGGEIVIEAIDLASAEE